MSAWEEGWKLAGALLRGLLVTPAGGRTVLNQELPSFHEEPQAPTGILESRDLQHLHPELRRRYINFRAMYMTMTNRQLLETCTWRSKQRQFEYFQVGRVLQGDVWVVVNKNIIKTNCDGFKIKSRHNVYPSEAVDVAIDLDPGVGKTLAWDRSLYEPFARLAQTHGLRWGGDWNGNLRTEDERFVDLPHLELPAL